jgi:hypothetical protein
MTEPRTCSDYGPEGGLFKLLSVHRKLREQRERAEDGKLVEVLKFEKEKDK